MNNYIVAVRNCASFFPSLEMKRWWHRMIVDNKLEGRNTIEDSREIGKISKKGGRVGNLFLKFL